jgi:PKD repeat protein
VPCSFDILYGVPNCFANDPIFDLECDMKAGKTHFWLRLSSVLWLLMGIAPLFAQSPRAERVKPPFPSMRFSRHFHNEEAIQALGGSLPAVASWYGKTADEMGRLLRHDRNLWVSPTGRLMYTCEMETPLEAGAVTATGVTRDHVAGFPLDQTFKLHSLPGSKKTIYLDFNGGTVSGTAWNAPSGAAIIAAPFDLDSAPGTFNTTELQVIQNVWKRVAEDYSPFDVDVTTEEPAADALTRSSSSDDTYGNRVMITPTNFYANAGGVSYVGVFDDVGDYYKTSWAFSNMLANGEKYIAEACSHENGHSVGLQHEGITGGTAYYQGQGDWAPIMGNSYYKNVTQWARGEYAGANNTEDQLQVMQNYGLAYFADDYGNTAATAAQMAVGTTISESGFIERNTDVDVFKLFAGAGALSINVSPAPLGPNLKILAELRDAGLNLLASSSLSNLGASISTTVPAGAYYLSISGIGSGDPAATGYSNYASLGQYVITGAVADPGSARPPTAVISATLTSGEAPLSVAFGATSDRTIYSYAWNFGDGSAVSTDSNPTHMFYATGIYTVTLTVTDNDGLMATASVTVTVTNDIYVTAIVTSSSASTTAVSAIASVTVLDRNGKPVPGATVAGSWSGLNQGTSSGATDASGVATLTSPQSSTSGTFLFTLSTVTAPSGYTYNLQLNKVTSVSILANLLPLPKDTTAPTISIKSPTAGATVSGTVSVLVSASDNVGVKKVELYVDGRLTATSTASPFTTKWNASKASKGSHAIQTKAYDAAGNNSTSASVTIKK